MRPAFLPRLVSSSIKIPVPVAHRENERPDRPRNPAPFVLKTAPGTRHCRNHPDQAGPLCRRMPNARRVVAGCRRQCQRHRWNIQYDYGERADEAVLALARFLLVTEQVRAPGVAGADPGRDCRIVSGPRSRTSPDAWEMRQKVPALQNFQLLPVAP